MSRTGSGIPRPGWLPHVKPAHHIRQLKPVFFVPAISSTISLLSIFTDLGTVTPWLPGDGHRRLPARRPALQMRRWFMVKTATDIVLATAAILGAFVAKQGTTGEARLSYRQGMVFTALRLVLSPQILRCVADVCFGRRDSEHVSYDDLGLLPFRFWAVDVPAMYCFIRAIKHARVR